MCVVSHGASASRWVQFALLYLNLCFVLLGTLSTHAYTDHIKDIHNNAAVIQIHGPKGWLPQDLSKLQLFFSPAIEQGIDYSVWEEPNKHTLPDHLRQLRQLHPTTLHVLLTPGKTWVKDMTINTTQNLRLVNIRNGNKDIHGYKNSRRGQGKEDVVARILHDPTPLPLCSLGLELPGASAALQKMVNTTLFHCQRPLIILSQLLKWKLFNTLDLLLLQPKILIVDATGQDRLTAAKSVDKFLAAHSVLDVVWEPLTEQEPPYWILMPRPLGMPGHLFAMLDILQWRSVRQPLITAEGACQQMPGVNCATGCSNTKLAGITGSGYSADAFNIFNVLREGFFRFEPVQAFPSTLGIRSTPPSECLSDIYICDPCGALFLSLSCHSV